jgi:RNA polymerase sporulation-specific sigma factor
MEPELKKIVARFYIEGADRQDVLQEARIGFVKAVEDYREDGGMTFKNFAINLCCKRHIITQINQALRKKYELHKKAIWLATPIRSGDGEAEQTLEDFIQDTSIEPVIDNILVKEENAEVTEMILRELTELEASIFLEYLEQKSYKQIGESVGVSQKVVDNGLMRIRKKLKKVYEEYQARQREREDWDGELHADEPSGLCAFLAEGDDDTNVDDGEDEA